MATLRQALSQGLRGHVDPDPPAGQAAQEKADAARQAKNSQAMNRFIRSRGGRRASSASSEPGTPPPRGFIGPEKLTRVESEKVYRLSTGQARDSGGRFVPKLEVTAAMDQVRSERKPWPPGSAGEGAGQVAQRPKPGMNSWIRWMARGVKMTDVELEATLESHGLVQGGLVDG